MKFKDKNTGAIVEVENKVVIPLYEKSNNFVKVKEKIQKPEGEAGKDKE